MQENYSMTRKIVIGLKKMKTYLIGKIQLIE